MRLEVGDQPLGLGVATLERRVPSVAVEGDEVRVAVVERVVHLALVVR